MKWNPRLFAKPHTCEGCKKQLTKGMKGIFTHCNYAGIHYKIYACNEKCAKVFEARRVV